MFDCIILAAGSGERFGKRKQFTMFRGKALWQHVHDACMIANKHANIYTVGIDFPGGKTRQESVLYGLRKVTSERVVILEAARPLVTPEQIINIAEAPHVSTTFVSPAVETVLYNGKHLDRNDCYVLQVPQAFHTRLLIEAHERTKWNNATDDTVLMQDVHGIQPHLILGGRNLYKVTLPHDLKIIKQIYEDYSNNGR